MQWVGILDCNNFFVSCERLFRPDLRNKPVAVLSSNDGCIVARSQEIKDMGIPMGVPYFKIKDIIKDTDTVTFSSHFALYRDLSRRVFETMRNEIGVVEQYSIDEAFFIFYGTETEAEQCARTLKDIIQTHVGLPVSIALAPSKTVAKYANDRAKKTGGIQVLAAPAWQELLPTVLLRDIWGVGRQLTKRFADAHMHTVADLVSADEAIVKSLFGVHGQKLQSELRCQPVYSVDVLHEPQQSVMSSRSFKQTSNDKAVLADAIAYHTRHIAEDLRTMRLKAAVLRISIQPSRYSDFVLQGSTMEVVLDEPTHDSITLLKVSNDMLEQAFKPGVPYKKVGVSVGQLSPETVTQQSLFTHAEEPRNNRLMSVLDDINAKAGRELVSVGNRLRGAAWQARTENISPAYTTKWTDVAKVKA